VPARATWLCVLVHLLGGLKPDPSNHAAAVVPRKKNVLGNYVAFEAQVSGGGSGGREVLAFPDFRALVVAFGSGDKDAADAVRPARFACGGVHGCASLVSV